MLQETKLQQSNEFRQRIKNLLIKVCHAIVGESETGQTEAYWSKRNLLGTNVLNDIGAYLDRFVDSCSVQAGLNSAITVGFNGELVYNGGQTLDQDIEFTITSVFDDIAGVRSSDKI